MPRARDELRHALRYAAIQIPGLIGWGLALIFAVHHEWIGEWLAAVIWSLFVGFDVVVYVRSRHTFDAPAHMGPESLPGREAVATTALAPEGFARIGSERWRARLSDGGRVEAGAPLRVEEVRGLELIVNPVDPVVPAREEP